MTNRRHFLSLAAGSAACAFAPASVARAAQPSAGDPQPSIRYCLNTSTIREQRLSVPEQIDLAAETGYDAIEPWIRDLRQYLEAGGTTADLRRQLQDRNITVESAIGFARWIVDDPQVRREGLEEARRDMQLIADIGGKRIAAPPAGATDKAGLSLAAAAERYAALLDLGREVGVVPQLELWGFSANLSRLGEVAFVATEAGHADACILPDVYHIYKGGSDFAGLAMLNGQRLHVFHMNDYPAAPPRETIGDADRVYPGDGVGPLSDILQTISAAGFRGVLSLELFNRDYWKQPAADVARTGLEKMKAAVAAAGVG